MPDTDKLLARAEKGDETALAELFTAQRSRLRRMVEIRMDRRLYGRIGASDILQEAFIEASSSLPSYLSRPDAPFWLWLRCITARKLLSLHRFHLGAQARDARREVALYHGAAPEATSEVLAARLLGDETSPSEAAMRAERRMRLQDALNTMDPLDREVLVLRHFEQLSGVEAARVLGLEESTARKRHVRALHRLREALRDEP